MSHPRVRTIRRSLAVVVLIVLLCYASGGWYFAGQIESGAFAVGVEPVVRDLRVASLHGARIGLADPGRQNLPLRSSMTYGVRWPGGYGRVSGGPSVSGDVVSRHWELVSGPAPALGTRVSLDGAAYPLDAAGTRLVHYRSPRGVMPATYFPGTGSSWAILVHGKGATRADVFRIAAITGKLGMPTLAIGYRNDPDAPRDRSGRYAYGVTEWRDLQAAVGWAREHGARGIVLGGTSMGGAIVASYLRNAAEAGQVLAVVLDAPMLNLRDTIGLAASQRRIPPGLPVPSSLTWAAEQIASLRYDVSWRAVDYLSDPEWVHAPTLIFHGAEDDIVPLSTSRRLAEESARVRLVVTPRAGHVASWNVDPARYAERVTAFLEPALR